MTSYLRLTFAVTTVATVAGMFWFVTGNSSTVSTADPTNPSTTRDVAASPRSYRAEVRVDSTANSVSKTDAGISRRLPTTVVAKRKKFHVNGLKRADQPDQAEAFFFEQRLSANVPQYPTKKLQDTARKMRNRANNANIAGGFVPPVTEIGPGNIGGRTRALVIDPTNPDIIFAAGVAGGVWKSTDGGDSWNNSDDMFANMAVCALVMDPTNPSILYAGTGEGFFNGDAVRGFGIYKTTDAGATWNLLNGTVSGVPDGAFFRVNKLAISPADPDVIYAATRFGVWKSIDAGMNWNVLLENTIFVDDPAIPNANGANAGCLDIAVLPDTAPGPDTILAAFGSFNPDGLFRS
ncbi:MAG: WD40/YVTN/BNR-like repeat-containing protein, partial [Phycisphaerae bacterium]